MSGRVRRFALGVASNYLRLLTGIGVFFVLTPRVVTRLGAETYGLWTFVTAVVAFFGLLEFGFGSATVRWFGRQSVADAGGDSARPAAARTFLVLHVLLGLLAALALSFVYVLIPRFASIDEQHVGLARLLVILFGLRQVVLYIPGSFFRSVLVARQRFATVNTIQATTQLLYGVVAWQALGHGIGAVGLASLYAATVGIELVSYGMASLRFLGPCFRVGSWFDRTIFRDVASFSFYSFVTQVSGLILLRTDPILVQFFLPLSAVAVYGLAMRLSQQLFLLFKQVTNVFAPFAAQFHASGDAAKLRFIVRNGSRFASLPATMVLIPAVMLASPAIVAWVGPDFAESARILRILVLASWLLVPQMTGAAVLTMTGGHRTTGRLSILSAGVNVLVSLVLVQRLGLIGVALGTLVAAFCVDFVGIVYASCRAVGLRYLHFLRDWVPSVVIPGGLNAAATWIVLQAVAPTGLWGIVLVAVPGAAIHLLVFVAFFTESGERALVRERLFAAHRPAR